MFSYLSKEKLDELDIEEFYEGDAVHLRRKSTQEPFELKEETRIFMELYEKYGIAWRAQYQHKGFWGTELRNDGRRWDFSVPQGVTEYKNSSQGWKVSDDAPDNDPYPRMYTESWLNS